MGVELSVSHIRVACTTPTGEVIHASAHALTDTTPQAVCVSISQYAQHAHHALTQGGYAVLGLGVGVPGAYDTAVQLLRFAPNLGWRHVPLQRLLSDALAAQGLADLALHIQNEADTAALSEYEFAGKAQDDSLVFVTCDVGVGAGIVINDRVFTGSQGMAGEIGHSVLQAGGALCSCGRRGCAETLIGAKALENASSREAAGAQLGLLLQNLWTTFNPSVLVLGGSSCSHYPELIATAQAGLNAYAQQAQIAAPTIRAAHYGIWASAVGAAALVLHKHLRPTGYGVSQAKRALPVAAAQAVSVSKKSNHLDQFSRPVPTIHTPPQKAAHVSWH